jgi:Family of unknown function (DUF5995)
MLNSIYPTNIADVLVALDKIIADSIHTQSPKGYFAALYRSVTAAVKKGIEQGHFEDGARMERLDVIFANRYLQAYDAYFSGHNCTKAWKIAFDEVKNNRLLVLQHLFLGMTAHIMLDLGIAAAETCPHNQIQSLEKDFKQINVLLGSMVDGVEAKLTEITPLFFIIDVFGAKNDEKLANFCMKIAREAAWMNAKRLAKVHGTPDWETQISRIDKETCLLSNSFIPKGLAIYSNRIARAWEIQSVAKIVEIMK